MKNIQSAIIIMLLIAFAFPHQAIAQETASSELSYGVYVNYPPLSQTKETVKEAHTLNDLNKHYKPSWVREYYSVEILTSHQGKIKKVVGKNDTLTKEQKDNMLQADPGSDISIKVHYLPENTLKQNDPKEFSFTFIINPENEAQFPGGQQQLIQYVKENAIDKIPEDVFRQYQLSAVKFSIDEKGKVIDPKLFWTSEDETTDQLMLELIQNMPNWTPSSYANGLKVKQEFVLTVGDMESCVTNMLNIRVD